MPQLPALVTVWVQLVTDNQALGGPTKIRLEAQSDVDDLCSEVRSQYPRHFRGGVDRLV